jgi:Phage tail assembly chaperone protein
MAKINRWALLEITHPDPAPGVAHPLGPIRDELPDGSIAPNQLWVQLDENDAYYIWKTWDFLANGRMIEQYRGLTFPNFHYDLGTATWTHDEPYRVTWQEVRDARMARLGDTDWVVVKFTELNQPLPEEWATWRQDLRDWPVTQAAAGFTAEQALENLNYHFDPATKARRISLGLSLDRPTE